MPSFIRRWSHLPGRIAVLLGLSALSIAGARAGTVDAHPGRDAAREPQQSAKSFGDLLIWLENGRIYVSEAGKPAEELQLGNSAEAASLRQLLVQQCATEATPHFLRDRIILVGSGGAGLHWDSQRPDASKKAHVRTTPNADKPMPGTAQAAEQQTGAAQSTINADGNSK
jgi:hypothetical protein